MTRSRVFTAIAIVTALVACILGLSVPMANAAELAYGTAVVDGNMGEWITDPLAPDTDFFA